jgi:outer membrane protein assembly factor BamB
MKRSRVMVLVAVLAGSLFLAGPLCSTTGPLWTQTFNFQPDRDKILVGAVAASNKTLIVCGTAYNSAVDTGDIGFIKAFDLATGGPKWQDTLTTGANRNGFDSLAVVGNTVLADGYSSTYTIDPGTHIYTYTLNQSILRAYNADTGNPLWAVDQNAAPLNLGPTNLVTTNNRVFVVRQEKGLFDPAGSGNCIVQAYQVGTPNVPVTSLLLE